MLTGRQVWQLLGHYDWAVLLRRPLLSVFSAGYKFADRAGDEAWRVWPCLRKKLLQAASLACFAHCDSRRDVVFTVLATDASGGECGDFGGYGVMERDWPAEAVRKVTSHA